MSNNTQIIVDESTLSTTNEIRKAITQKHKKVSFTPTPAPFVKQRQGQDYVEIGYMREIADKEYAGWSWKIVKTENLGSAAYVVHGRLKWYDEGIWRTGDMVAAHRIQKKQGTNTFVDIGNDVKAANTDTMKKAYNMHMNIADDVYRNKYEEIELSENQKKTLLLLAKKVGMQKTIKEKIDSNEIHGKNYSAAIGKLTIKEKELENV